MSKLYTLNLYETNWTVRLTKELIHPGKIKFVTEPYIFISIKHNFHHLPNDQSLWSYEIAYNLHNIWNYLALMTYKTYEVIFKKNRQVRQ